VTIKVNGQQVWSGDVGVSPGNADTEAPGTYSTTQTIAGSYFRVGVNTVEATAGNKCGVNSVTARASVLQPMCEWFI